MCGRVYEERQHLEKKAVKEFFKSLWDSQSYYAILETERCVRSLPLSCLSAPTVNTLKVLLSHQSASGPLLF